MQPDARYAALVPLAAALARLPKAAPWRLGPLVGRIGAAIAKRRRAIAARNLELCFPELAENQRAALLTAHFEALGTTLLETPRAWLADHDGAEFSIEGLEHLDRSADPRGILLLGMHAVNLEMAAAGLGAATVLDGTYRAHDDEAFEALQRRGRGRHLARLIDRRDLRAMVRSLRAGRVLWYAPDQDYGADHARFAPFFGQSAATITLPTRLARAGRARVCFVEHWRDVARRRTHLAIHPAPEGFPRGDVLRDATVTNGVFETFIRRHPEQYLWVHRRFKTQPPGSNAPY